MSRVEYTQEATISCRYGRITARITNGRVSITESAAEDSDWEFAKRDAEARLKLIAKARKLHRAMFGRNPR